MRLMRRGILGCVAVMFLIASVARAGVMDQVPEDALVVLKIRNLTATSGKLGKFMTDLGVAAMEPGLADPLTFLTKKANISQGLKADGELAAVFLDPAKTAESPDNSMVLLIPVTDYAAFLGNFADAKTEDGVSELKMGDSPKPGYMSDWGGFAALSPSKTIVAKKPSAMLKVAGAATAQELSGKDVILFANFVGLRAQLLPVLQGSKDEILAQVESGVKSEEKMAKFAPVIRTVVSQVILMGESFLRDANSASVGLNFGADGINLTVMAEFEKGSYLGDVVAMEKCTDEQFLRGLPTGKYLFFGGGCENSKVALKVIDDFVAPILKEVNAMGPEMSAANDYMDSLRAYIAAIKGQAIGFVAPTGALGQEAIIQFINVSAGDGAAQSAAYQRMLQAQEELMKSFGAAADAWKTTFTPAAKVLDGVSFDNISTVFNMNAQDPMGMQQAQIMAMLYGPGGVNVLMGPAGDNLIMASGVRDPILSATIKAIKENAAPLADLPGVKSVSANLPKIRAAALFVPVDEIVNTGLTYAKQFGAGLQVQLPPDLPPIGFTISTEGTAAKIDAYVPSTLVQSLVAAGMQAAMQMRGGNKPGGAGGL
ncbi:MAG: hypothetical protein ACREJC_02565 [Tepidisphaeraceae bacterium]